jgi:hypothetical protein
MNSTLNNSFADERPPVIILGAARSGTKLLRALVGATGCYAEVPFDVNYIWRYGNESCLHDALSPAQLTEQTRQFIRRYLPRCAVEQSSKSAGRVLWQAGKSAPRASSFVEKTVSNVLRVSFVKAVYPEAKFIAIIRDGRDVVESAERCWRESPRAGRLLAKMRKFPWRDCSPYGWKFAVRTVRRCLGIDQHVRSWGPRYPNIDTDVRDRSLLEVCARQWLTCMEYYMQARGVFAADQLLELRYEDLVHAPAAETNRLCEFLEVADREPALEFARRLISTSRLGSSRRLKPAEAELVMEIISAGLRRWNYELARAA